MAELLIEVSDDEDGEQTGGGEIAHLTGSKGRREGMAFLNLFLRACSK